YFEKVKAYLDVMNIPYTIDPTLVRGLDYYNHTAFEIMSDAEGFGAITTLLGGGRYNGLTEQLGGPESPGIGFGMGRSEEHTSELQSRFDLVCRLLLEKKKKK